MEIKTPEIHRTMDYDKLKLLKFNRNSSKGAIERMKKAMQKEFLLQFHPIVVNEKLEIIAGQHRYVAAKELGLELFYVQGDVSYDHVIDDNMNHKKQELYDVIKFYAVKDMIPSYRALDDYINRLNISPKALIGLIFGVLSIPMVDFIKSGKFELPNNKKVMDTVIDRFFEFKEFVKEKRITPSSMFNSSNFTVAFRNLVLLSDFKEEIWSSKLEQRWFDLKPQLNSKEWTRQLVSIYNWKNHNPIQLND
jgi:hypothetical protein